jgi:SAM-dependent methyltransferase
LSGHFSDEHHKNGGVDEYERSAEAYDLIQDSRGRSYEEHVEALLAVIKWKCPEARSLLDVACGTGKHLAAFQETFTDLAGVDLSPAMLARARERVPGVPLHEADMRTFDLGRTFDVVTCLFSSIGYLLEVDGLRAAVANMARHVAAGGVLIVEPWIHPDGWTVPHLVAEGANAPGMAVGRVSTNGQRGHISTFDLHWTIATPDGVEQFVEQHELGLWTIAEYRDAFERAGLEVEHDPRGLIGRGLFIGSRSA